MDLNSNQLIGREGENEVFTEVGRKNGCLGGENIPNTENLPSFILGNRLTGLEW